MDTTLSNARQVIGGSSGKFPDRLLNERFASIGRSLRFEMEEIDDLVDCEFGDPRSFTVLTQLYPDADLGRASFHVDHIYPRSQLTRTRLKKAGVPEERISEFLERRNRIPNLQLLEQQKNVKKTDLLPTVWLDREYDSPKAKEDWKRRTDVDVLPTNVAAFLEFYEDRRVTSEVLRVDATKPYVFQLPAGR